MKLTRSTSDSVFAGVCGGLAEQLGWSPSRLRVAWALATLFTAFAGLIFYFAFCFLMTKASLPFEPAAEQPWRRAT